MLFERNELWEKCDFCGQESEHFSSLRELDTKLMSYGWEFLLNVAMCPRCHEEGGKLPDDIQVDVVEVKRADSVSNQ